MQNQTLTDRERIACLANQIGLQDYYTKRNAEKAEKILNKLKKRS